MKRPFPRCEVLGLTAALVLVSSCEPNNSVKSGAPVLTELSILEPGAAGPTPTTVTAATLTCPGGTAEGGPCDPTATTAVCEGATNNLCRCQATMAAAPAATDAGAVDAAPPPAGLWSCSFAPMSMVLYVFDRVLDSAPLDPGDGAPLTTIATPTFVPPAPTVSLLGDYASNGSPNEVIFPLLGAFRSDGPSLLFTGQPTLPTGTTVTVALDKTKVLAKDGRTPFTGTGLLMDGMISFVTQPLIAVVAGPPAPAAPADAGADAAAPLPLPDMTPGTITFNNPVDPTAVAKLVTASAIPAGAPPTTVGTPVQVVAASMDGLNFTVTPETTWPASSMITITVSAAATDVLGDALGTDATGNFTTSAM